MTISKKRQLIEKLELNQSQHNLIDLLELFAWYQDYRKEYTMKLLRWIDAILEEVGRRKNISIEQMRYSLPSEIAQGSFNIQTLQLRQQEFVAVWQPKESNKTQYYTENAAQVWKELNLQIKHSSEQLEISGSGSSPGIARGRAMVTMDAREAAKIKPGQILVTSMTTPDFIMAMKKAAGVVTNEGGILCHAAVISREFGIPCVVGTKIATKTIKNGDQIEIDGSLGTVRKLPASNFY